MHDTYAIHSRRVHPGTRHEPSLLTRVPLYLENAFEPHARRVIAFVISATTVQLDTVHNFTLVDSTEKS